MSGSHPFSVDAARDAAERDGLRTWLVEFLSSPGSDNAPLAATLSERYPWWLGPLRLPLDQLNRLAGPSDQPVLVEVDEDEWRDDVEDMKDLVDDGWEPPPLVATWRGDRVVVEDGNHRAESLRRAGVEEAWVIVGFEDADERERFRRDPLV
jgi:hypothetical protein